MLYCKTVTKWREKKAFCFFFLVAGVLTASLLVLGSLYCIRQHQKCEVWSDKCWWNVLCIHWARRAHTFRALDCILCLGTIQSVNGRVLVLSIQYKCILHEYSNISIRLSLSGGLSVTRMKWQGTFSCHTAKISQRMREVTFPSCPRIKECLLLLTLDW